MQFTYSTVRGRAGAGTGAGAVLAVVLALVLAGCTAPTPTLAPTPQPTTTLELAQPAEPTVQPPPATPLVSAPPAEAPSALRARPRDATPEAVTQPVPLRRPAPRYPDGLVETEVPGVVVASFVIGAQGRPEDVRIESSSHPMFTKEVNAVLPLWRFEPARDAAGRVVRQRMRVPFRFLLED